MSAHDPGLPILEEIETAMRARAAEVLAAAGEPAAGAPRFLRPRAVAGSARRTLVLVALLCLVCATAIAARAIVAGGDPARPSSATVLLAHGRIAGEDWRLTAYRRSGRTCFLFVASGSVATRCFAAPTGTDVRVAGALTGASRFEAGFTGPDVEWVTIAAGGAKRTAKTAPLPSGTAAARTARLPRGVRWFVARLGRAAPGRGERPARVSAAARTGRRLGKPVLDCTVGQATTTCRRAAARP